MRWGFGISSSLIDRQALGSVSLRSLERSQIDYWFQVTGVRPKRLTPGIRCCVQAVAGRAIFYYLRRKSRY